MPAQDNENRSHWKQLIQQQIKSGLPASKFCMDHNLKAHQFSYYKRLLFPLKIKNTSGFVKVLEINQPEDVEPTRIVLYFKELSLCFEGSHDPQTIVDLCVLLSAQE
jgi:hypothetical protein